MCLTSIFLIIHSCLIIQAKPHLFLSLILLLADFRGYQNRLEGLLKFRLLDRTQNFWCRRSGRAQGFYISHKFIDDTNATGLWITNENHGVNIAVMGSTVNMSCTYIKLMWKKFKSREQIFFSVSFYIPGLKSWVQNEVIVRVIVYLKIFLCVLFF